MKTTDIPPLPAPAGTLLSARHQHLLWLEAGSEIRCLQGRLGLFSASDPLSGLQPPAQLQAHQAWRCPGPAPVCLRLDAAADSVRYQITPAQPLAAETQTQKSRSGLTLERLGRMLAKLRPVQRAA